MKYTENDEEEQEHIINKDVTQKKDIPIIDISDDETMLNPLKEYNKRYIISDEDIIEDSPTGFIIRNY